MIDGLLINKIKTNLNNKIISGKIQRIYQINNYELTFKIRAFHHNHNLINSIHATDFRLHLTNKEYTTLDKATNFTMLLRKHLEGGIIKKIEQYECERIIIFEIEKMNELKDLKTKYLIFELLGRHSNTILCDHDFKIIQTFKPVPIHQNMTRILHKGAIYQYIDTKNKLNPLISINNSLNYLDEYQGFSKEVNQQFLDYQDLYSASTLLNCYLNNEEGYIYQKNITFLKPLNHEFLIFKDLDLAFDDIYQHQSNNQSINTLFKKEINELKNGIKRNKRKKAKLQQQYQDNLNYQEYQTIGTLLFDNIYRFNKNDHYEQVNIFNYETNESQNFKLNNKLTYLENAQAYLKKYHKLKKSFTYLEEQLLSAQNDAYLYQSAYDMIDYANVEDFIEMIDQLHHYQLINLNKNTKKNKKNKTKILNYSCFKDENNNQYYVGKNALQNNYLSFKLAQPHDLWLHIKDLSGAHVIIKSNDINDDILLKGARLALAFSKATINNNYEVQYTLVKNLKKIKGQLGRVSFTTHQSIIVLNDQQILKELEQIK